MTTNAGAAEDLRGDAGRKPQEGPQPAEVDVAVSGQCTSQRAPNRPDRTGHRRRNPPCHRRNLPNWKRADPIASVPVGAATELRAIQSAHTSKMREGRNRDYYLKKRNQSRTHKQAVIALAAAESTSSGPCSATNGSTPPPQSGGPQGSNLRAPTERSVTVSRHSALLIPERHRRRASRPSGEKAWALDRGVRATTRGRP